MTAERDTNVETRLAIQFENVAKQEHAIRFGMWVFLSSELLLFGGLFALYTAYRSLYSAEFSSAFHHNWLLLGSLNTVILITSSFTVAWAIHCVRTERRRTAIWALVITMLFGFLFLVFKAIEYAQHFREGIYPGQHYAFAELPGHGARMFFTLYYFMTGLHALHMVAGLVIVSWMIHRVARRLSTRVRHGELELGALYWHLVDCIWIFLWPLFYLAG